MPRTRARALATITIQSPCPRISPMYLKAWYEAYPGMDRPINSAKLSAAEDLVRAARDKIPPPIGQSAITILVVSGKISNLTKSHPETTPSFGISNQGIKKPATIATPTQKIRNLFIYDSKFNLTDQQADNNKGITTPMNMINVKATNGAVESSLLSGGAFRAYYCSQRNPQKDLPE